MKTIASSSRKQGREVKFHVYSQTSTAKCNASFLEDFPEFEFPVSSTVKNQGSTQ
jgi:hypothetical protein